MTAAPVIVPRASKPKDPYTFFRANLLASERVRELSQLRPARVVVDTVLCWAAILGAWGLVAWRPAVWSVLLALVVVGSRYYALFIIGHDGLHRRLLRDRRWNDLFNDLLILGPIGAITRINNRNHLQHHQHLASEQDPDRHRHACFNKTELSEVFGYATGVTSIARSVRLVFFTNSRARRAAAITPRALSVVPSAVVIPSVSEEPSSSRKRAESDGYTRRDLGILLGWQAALIGGLTWAIAWWAYPVLWLLPVYAFTYLADNFRSFLEHSHPEADERADEHRLITFDSSRLERWFVAPMNMNYHAAHHLWVSIPYYNLPVADREMRVMAAARTLEWRGSYFAYFLRYCGALPLEECKSAGDEGTARSTRRA